MDIYHQCKNCHYFKVYYIKGFCQFLKTDYGNCIRHNKNMEKHESCVEWIKKKAPPQRKEEEAQKILLKCCNSIIEIKQILYEDQPIEHEL